MAGTLDPIRLAFLLGTAAVLAGCDRPSHSTMFSAEPSRPAAFSVKLSVKTDASLGMDALLRETDIYAQSIHYTRAPSIHHSDAVPATVSTQISCSWANSEPKIEDDFDVREIDFFGRVEDKAATITFNDYGGTHATSMRYSADMFRARLATRYPDAFVEVLP